MKGNQTEQTRLAVEGLNRWTSHDVSGFMLKCMTKEAEILDVIANRVEAYKAEVRAMPNVAAERIVQNHGQLHALLDALTIILPLTDTQLQRTHAFITELAIQRQKVISSDHPLIEAFWDIYEFLEGDNEKVVNHAIDDQLIAINLNQFLEEATSRKQSLPPLPELKGLLTQSQKYKYIEHNKTVKSAVHRKLKRNHPNMKLSETKKCWIFKLGG